MVLSPKHIKDLRRTHKKSIPGALAYLCVRPIVELLVDEVLGLDQRSKASLLMQNILKGRVVKKSKMRSMRKAIEHE